MERQSTVSGVRYRLIDTLRGLSLLSMLAFHFCYDVFVIYGGSFEWTLHPAVAAWERSICVSFILISGMALNFSRHAYRRALIINACGLVITLVTWLFMPGQIILFGILNGIGCAMLVTQALRRRLEKCNPFAGAAVSLLLFGLSYGLPFRYFGFFEWRLCALPEALYQCPPLAALGLPADGFFSADYFPLLPWLFLFVCGFFVWRAIVRLRADRLFLRGLPVLDFIGKHTLWIYMIHQPLLMGICFLMFGGI